MTQKARSDDRLDRAVLTVAVVVVIGAIMSILDTTIVNVALETLSRDLHSPLNEVQWVATGYLLALATVIPLTGWASERFGPKRVWMTSVFLFVVGSALCGAAWSATSLIVFRVLQGFGGGMVMPVGMIILAQTAGPHRVGRVMSVVGVPMLLGPVLGPVLGGLIVSNLSWRWIFYVNLPIGAVGLALASRLLPSARSRDAGPLDWRGVALLSPGLALIVYGLSEVASHGGASSATTIGPIAGGAAFVAAFAWRSLRVPRPLIDVQLFKRREFSAAAATTFTVGAALFGALLLLPLYYQTARGESALAAGLLMAPQGLGAAFAMPFAGRLTDRVGGGRVALVGLTVMAIGTIPFTGLTAHTPYALLAGSLFVRGIGLGSSMMPAMAGAYAALDTAAVPRATSALNVIQRVGGSIGTALLAVVLQRSLPAAVGSAGGAIGAVGAISPTARAHAAPAIAHAFGTAFWWAMGLTLVALVPAAMLAAANRRARAAATAANVPA